jgi:N-acetylglucosamine-6-phosphate deacetylase
MTTIAGRIVTPECILNGVAQIQEDRISTITVDYDGDVEYDFGDALIVPGFIDLHLHGLGSSLLFAANDIATAAALQPKYGTTSFLPSLPASTEERFLQFGRNVREAQSNAKSGSARILGAHFEGPFINPTRKGGMTAEYLRAPDIEECRRYLAEVGDVMKLMTLSPELDNALDIVHLLRKNGVVVSLGHTDAQPEEVDAAIDAGLSHVCHLYNTFDRPIIPEMGCWPRSLIPTILASDALTCELICDLQHVLPEYLKFTAHALAPDRFIAVSDSARGAGRPPGQYTARDGNVFSTESGAARLVDTGELIGSVITMDRAFANLAEVIELDIPLAARFTSTNAARAIGMDADVGSIEPGKLADLAVLDSNYNCIATFINGQLIYDAR